MDEKALEILESLNIYEKLLYWDIFEGKVNVELIYISESKISFKFNIRKGFQDIFEFCPEFQQYQDQSVNSMEESYSFYLMQKLYMPVFEIVELREQNPDMTWHAPIFKSLKYNVRDAAIDFAEGKIPSFVVEYDYMTEDVSKGYEYW